MANEICVFCGEKHSAFRSALIQCGSTWQKACKTCEKELRDLDEIEVCRRALIRGIAENPDKLRERINLITEAECHALIDQAVAEGITYAKNNKESNSERHVYMLLSGKRTIGKVVTQPGAPDENGLRIWNATE